MARLDLGAGLVVFPDLVPLLDEIGDRADVYELDRDLLAPHRRRRSALAHRPGRVRLDRRPASTRVGARGQRAGGRHRPPDPRAVALFAESVAALGAVAASEHLAFNRAVVDGSTVETGLFLPRAPAMRSSSWRSSRSPPTSDTCRCRSASRTPSATCALARRPPDSTIVARVAEGADCGILLDLHNLWCNERNGRESMDDALARLPMERVTEVHLAGGQWLGGCYLDAHSGPVDPALMATAARVLPMLPEVRAVLFEILPSRLWASASTPSSPSSSRCRTSSRGPADWRVADRPPSHMIETPDIGTDRSMPTARPTRRRRHGSRTWRRRLSASRRPSTTLPCRCSGSCSTRARGAVSAPRHGPRSACCWCRAPTTSTASSTTTAGSATPPVEPRRRRELLSWLAAQELPIARLGDAVQLDLAALRHGSTARRSRSCWTATRTACSPHWRPATSRRRRTGRRWPRSAERRGRLTTADGRTVRRRRCRGRRRGPAPSS